MCVVAVLTEKSRTTFATSCLLESFSAYEKQQEYQIRTLFFFGGGGVGWGGLLVSQSILKMRGTNLKILYML